MSELSDVYEQLFAGDDFTTQQAEQVMDRVMDGKLDEAQIGALLAALRAKGETSKEIAGFARSMRSHARSFELDDTYRPLIDTCGTGGDQVETINISTLSALVAAGAGVRVAKHGNRSVSSQCGSADLLEALGVKLELEPAQVKQSIMKTGIGFMYAPAFHKAMRHAIGPRKSLGVRTVFNLLGPLTNPAGADRQLLGVFSRDWVRPIAEALQELGLERAMVVHGEIGMDEISLSGETFYAEVNGDEVSEGVLKPDDFGMEPIDIEDIAGGDPDHNSALTRRLLDNDLEGPIQQIICANAGAVIYLAGEADDLQEGAGQARQSIAEGDARRALEDLVNFTRSVD